MAGQGRRLRHPGPSRALRGGPARQLLRRDGAAALRDGAAPGADGASRVAGQDRTARVNEEILVNVTPQETRVAVLAAGQVQELVVEREASRGLVGNIYVGRVVRVLPGMQSAFVDIGLERSAFLHVADVWEPRQAGALGREERPGP